MADLLVPILGASPILLSAVAAGAILWETLLRALIRRRLQRHLRETGVSLAVSFYGRRCNLMLVSRFGANRSGHLRLAAAVSEAHLGRLLDLYRRSVPAWCRTAP